MAIRVITKQAESHNKSTEIRQSPPLFADVKRAAVIRLAQMCRSLEIGAFTKSARAKNHRGVDLASDALPFGGRWYGEPNAVSNAIGYAKFRSRYP